MKTREAFQLYSKRRKFSGAFHSTESVFISRNRFRCVFFVFLPFLPNGFCEIFSPFEWNSWFRCVCWLESRISSASTSPLCAGQNNKWTVKSAPQNYYGWPLDKARMPTCWCGNLKADYWHIRNVHINTLSWNSNCSYQSLLSSARLHLHCESTPNHWLALTMEAHFQ